MMNEGTDMVSLYVAGQKVDWRDAELLLAKKEFNSASRIELRDDEGKLLARVVPECSPLNDRANPDWEATITQEEIERRLAGEFVTFEELKTRLGWK
jgi:hypothetical protein